MENTCGTICGLENINHILHRYVYCQYGTWAEAWAPNKTTLRKVTIGKIDEIIEAINKNQKEE